MDKTETLQKIYEESGRLLVKKGYDEVTIDEICAASGISKPTFYAYNLTKRDLLIHLFNSAPWTETQSEKLEEDFMSKIHRHLDQIGNRLYHFGPDLLRDLLKLHLISPALEEIIGTEWADEMTELITEAQFNREILTSSKPAQLTEVLVTYLIGRCFRYAIERSEDHLVNLSEATDVILRKRMDHES